MSSERIEVKTGWIRLKIRVGMASVATWVRGADIARISTISMPGVAGNAGTSQVEMEGGGNGQVVDHSPAEIIEAIKACERCTGLCECGTCKIKYLQSNVTGFQGDIRYLQAINGKLCAEVEDLRGRLALARPTKEDEEAMALIRSAANHLKSAAPETLMQDEVQGFSLQKVREWLEKHGWVPCASEQDCVLYADKAGRVVWVPESLGAGVSGREQRRIFSDTLKTLAPELESVCEG